MPVTLEARPAGGNRLGSGISDAGSNQTPVYPYVEKLEQALALRLGVRHAVAISGSAGDLHRALKAVGIGLGDNALIADLSLSGGDAAVLLTTNDHGLACSLRALCDPAKPGLTTGFPPRMSNLQAATRMPDLSSQAPEVAQAHRLSPSSAMRAEVLVAG